MHLDPEKFNYQIIYGPAQRAGCVSTIVVVVDGGDDVGRIGRRGRHNSHGICTVITSNNCPGTSHAEN